MEIQLLGRTDRNPLGYRLGDPIHFTFSIHDGGQPLPAGPLQIQWRRQGDDGVEEEGTAPIAADKPACVTVALEKPGFVFLTAALQTADGQAVLRHDGKPVLFEGGAGAAVNEISFVPPPPDFDAFWREQRAALASVPLEADIVEREPLETAVVYTVSVSCAGPRPATAFMCIPIGARPGSCKAQLHFDGYGFDLPKYQNLLKVSPADAIHIYMNAHGAELLNPEQAYYLRLNDETKSNGQLYAFDPAQNQRPQDAYFLQMAWRVLRMVEFVRTLPEWNGRDISLNGNSQGGLQSIWGAALSPHVTECHPSIPWHCDVAGQSRFGRLFGDWRIPYMPGLEYFDCVNMARLIKCPVTVERAGLGDYICPPSGVSLFYRAMKCPKAIRWFQGTTHIYVPRCFAETFYFEGDF